MDLALELAPGSVRVAAVTRDEDAGTFDLGRPETFATPEWPTGRCDAIASQATVGSRYDERNPPVEAAIDRTNEISSALRCRLSEAEPPESVDPEAQHRHLLLQGLAQGAELDAKPPSRRGLFRRSR